MKNLVKINEIDLSVKEFNGERVVTAWDVSKVHKKEVNDITKNFNNNRNKFLLGEDYFLVNKKEISERNISIQDFIPNNVKEIVLFTESGYLMLVKTFTDDLSWNIQRQLVKGYFRLKELVTTKEQYFINILRANDELETTLALKEFNDKYIKPLETENTEVKQKLEYKQEVINGLVGDTKLQTQRQFLNEIIKMKGVSLIKDRWNLLYNLYDKHKHMNIGARLEGYNMKQKKKKDKLNKLQYIDYILQDIPTLYKLAIKLFESDFKDKLQKYIEVL